jgi:hypothetical protein
LPLELLIAATRKPPIELEFEPRFALVLGVNLLAFGVFLALNEPSLLLFMSAAIGAQLCLLDVATQ